jgi:hypothetical protein
VAGAGSAYQVPAAAAFIAGLPARGRGQAIGLVSSGLIAIQGIGVLAFGGVASAIDPAVAVGLAGIAAGLAAVPLALAWTRVGAHPTPMPIIGPAR